jgi:virginiamycin A acetyltransferase
MRKIIFFLKIIKSILNQALSAFDLIKFQAYWRMINPHNFTSVGKIFPLKCVTVGEKSYGELNIYSYSNGLNEKLTIGNYVSIANDVSFILGGNHNIDTITTYPLKNFLLNDSFKDVFSRGPIIIENEVWIGYGSIIMSGIKIGKGAIIGAGSLVVKDVPPYAIIGGNPAKIIKYRFEEPTVQQLLKIDLSEFEIDFVKKNINKFYCKINSPKDLDFYLKYKNKISD